MTPVQAQSIGIFAWSTLLGPNGLSVAMQEICPHLGWKKDFPQDVAVETREVLKQLSPVLQTEGLDTEALQHQLTELEFGERPVFEEHPIYGDWEILGEISHTLQVFPSEPYSRAADVVRSGNNYELRLSDVSTRYVDAFRSILEGAKSRELVEDFSKRSTEDLFSLVISQTTQEIRWRALEALRSRKEHRKIVELLGAYPRETYMWISDFTGFEVDRPFKHAVFALIQKYFDEFKEFPLALIFVAKLDEARAREALELLVEKGDARQIAVVRKQAKSQQIRWNARAALDAKVDVIENEDALETVAAFGKNVEARLQAVSRLIGRGAQSALHRVATGEGLGWGWSEYQNATVIEAAKEGESQLIAEKSAQMESET